jgi:hypothetical protein
MLVLALVACRHPKPAPPSDPLAVELTSPGAEPRHLVHYAIAKGTKVPLELAIDANMMMGNLGGPIPTQVFDLEVAIDDVLTDGRMQVRTTIVDAQAREVAESKVDVAALAARLTAVKGLAFTGTLSPDGRLVGAHVDSPGKTLPPEIAQQVDTLMQGFEHVAMPLPREPIGVGAKWKTTRELEQNGIKTTTTNIVDVTALDGEKLSFRLQTELHGVDQTVVMGATAIDVTNLGGTGSGSGTIDLAHFAMTGELVAKMHATMATQGEASGLVYEMKTTIGPTQGAQSAP